MFAEKLESVVVATLPVALALVVPTIIAIKAEEKRAKLTLQHLSLIDNLPDTFYRTDLEGNIIWMSPAHEKMFGWKHGEVIGKKMSEFYYDPTDREKFVQAMRETGGDVKNLQRRILTAG